MWDELGISAGTGLIVLIALYFVIKWGVKNGIRDYFEGEKPEKIISKGIKKYSEDQRDEEGEAEDI